MILVKKLSDPQYCFEKLNGSKPFTLLFNGDLSAHWKLTGRGYGMKSHDGYPCHLCAIKDNCTHVPNSVLCDKWCKKLHKDKTDWKCYHHDFLDENKINELEEELLPLTKE
jgi:hypothetical protein